MDLHAYNRGSVISDNKVYHTQLKQENILTTANGQYASATSVRFNSGYTTSITNKELVPSISPTFYYSHEVTNNLPVVGSNFADALYHQNSTNTSTGDSFKPMGNFLIDSKDKMTVLPKSSSANFGISAVGKNITTASNEEHGKFNPVSVARSILEHNHKSAEKYFIFSSGDIYPDSAQRTDNILNGTKQFTDYNIMLIGAPTKTESTITYENNVGKRSRLNNTEET